MKITTPLAILLACFILPSATAQEVYMEEIVEVNFVGYDNDLPVFEMRADTGFQQYKILAKLEGDKPIEIKNVTDFQSIFHYANGSIAGNLDNGFQAFFDEGEIELYGDDFRDWDAEDELDRLYGKYDMSNVAFSADGTTFYYPQHQRLALRTYQAGNNDIQLMDMSAIDEYGTISFPQTGGEKIYFMAAAMGPGEIYAYDPVSEELTKAPIELSSKKPFGFKVHPDGGEMLVIYKGLLLNYDFSSDDFQQVAELPVRQLKQLDWRQVYYNKQAGTWEYVTLEEENLAMKTISFKEPSLSLAEVEQLSEKMAQENQTPMQAFQAMMKSMGKVRPPLTDEQKRKVDENTSAFAKKYQDQMDDPQVGKVKQTVYTIRMDTAYVPTKTAEQGYEHYKQMIEEGKVQMKPMTVLRLAGGMSSVPSKTDPKRVALIQALTDQYMESHTVDTPEKFETVNAGLQMVTVLSAVNGDYRTAAEYNAKTIHYYETIEDLNYYTADAYKEQVRLLTESGNYKQAITMAEAFLERDDLMGNEKLLVNIFYAMALAHENQAGKAQERLNEVQEVIMKDYEQPEQDLLYFRWLRAQAVVQHKSKAKDSLDQTLDQLGEYLKQHQDSKRYRMMYDEVEALFGKVGQGQRLNKLPVPKSE